MLDRALVRIWFPLFTCDRVVFQQQRIPSSFQFLIHVKPQNTTICAFKNVYKFFCAFCVIKVKSVMFKIKLSQLMRSWYYHIGDQWRLGRACASTQSRQSLRCSHTWSMEVDESPTKKQTYSPTGWLRMHIWRMSLRRTKSAISWLKLISKCLTNCIIFAAVVKHELLQ